MQNSSSSEPIIVACAADNFFSMPLAVTTFSAFSNLNPERQLILYILDGGISGANKDKLLKTLNSDRIQVNWIKPTAEQIRKTLLKCRASNHPISNYYRLLLPSIIPTEFKKVIYLDSDIVVEGDLAELWNIDIENCYLLAVQDPIHCKVLAADHLKSLHLEKQGITPECKYLNAGLLVINLDKWRADQIAERVLEYIGNHPDLPFPDQDAINIVLANQWKEISPLWNQIHIVHVFEPHESPYDESIYSDLVEKPYVIHYTSRPKPWGKDCTHPQADRYFKYLDQTAWSGWRNTVVNYNINLARRSIRRLRMAIAKWINQVSYT